MARFKIVLPSVRAFLVTFIATLLVSVGHAQITNVTDDTSTPIPGVGHDYIHLLSETVNPANGSVSLRIELPTPKGRGITIPFSIGYDSDVVSHIIGGAIAGTATWWDNHGSVSQGGWQYTVPAASFSETHYIQDPNSLTPTTCYVDTNFIFTDPSGSSHPLNLASGYSEGPTWCPGVSALYMNPSGDVIVQAFLPQLVGGPYNGNSPYPQPLIVYTADGTVYQFPAVGNGLGCLPSSIEDRNGNLVVETPGNYCSANFTFQDTAGRTAISSSGMGPNGSTNTLTSSGASYGVTWKTVSPNFSVPSNQVDSIPGAYCSAPPARTGNVTTVSQITLPNGKFYKFYYGTDNPNSGYSNPYGLLSEIDYPDGGWVRYTWKLSDTLNELAVYSGIGDSGQASPTGCVYEYKTPVVATRQVGFGGSSPSLTQVFNYSTTWGTSEADLTIWTQKQTTVCETDNVRGSAVCTTPSSVPANAFLTAYAYTYSYQSLNTIFYTGRPYSPQIPLEASVATYNWGSTSSVAQTVNKTWNGPFEMTSQTTVIGSLSSLVTHAYGAFAQPVETDEYDYGATTPSRKTINTYQSFPKTVSNYQSFPNNLGFLYDKPCKTVVTDGNNNQVSETDYYYDGGTALCGTVPAPTVTSVPGGLIAGTHDETNYGATSTWARGNVTQIVKWLNGGTSPTTTYTYDETGQVLSMTDPCGNGTCSDMASGSHTTTYSYSDSYSSGAPSGNTNTYLTTVTDPLSHTKSFTYGYADGQLTSATDNGNSATTTFKYNIQPSGCSYLDKLDRLGEIDYPDGGITTYCYNDTAYNPTTPSPSVTTTKAVAAGVNKVGVAARDGMGHTVETVLSSDPDGATFTVTSYYGTGQPYQAYNPTRCSSPTTNCGETTWGVSAYFYDTLGRSTQVSEPDGSVVQTTYSANTSATPPGYLTAVTDEVGNQHSRQTDALGRLTYVWEAPNNSSYNYQTAYTYDTLNNLLSVNQTGGSRTRTFTYDSLSRLLCAANPEIKIVTCPTSGTTFPAGAVTYAYDLNGNLSSRISPRPGQTTGTLTVTANHRYDVLNRLTQTSYAGVTTPLELFAYDGTILTTCGQNPPAITSPTNLIGRRSAMCVGGGGKSGSSWSYDKIGRPVIDLRINAGGGNQTKLSVGYGYYLDGSLKTLTYPSGDVVSYTVGGAGRATQVSDSSNNYVGYSGHPATFTPGGSLTSMINGYTSTFAGITSSNVYNDRLQPILLATSTGSGSLFKLCYDFHLSVAIGAPCNIGAYTTGDNGNVFRILNQIDSTRSTTFAYDPLNRIAQANTITTTGPHCWGEVYTIDAWSNLTNIGGVSGMTGCSTESPNHAPADSQNHLNGLSYDIAGNIVNDGLGNTPTYDAKSRIVSDASATYYYDAEGVRIEKSSGTKYWPGPSGTLTESGLTGTINEEYIHFNGARIARVDRPSGTVHYYFSNHLGSHTVVTNAGGNCEQDIDYYPYGRIEWDYCPTVAQHYKFTGKERDMESGLDNFGARYYESAMGGFMTLDDGSDQDSGDPQSWNLYAYVRNNPLINTDPTGRACVQEANQGWHDDNSPGETCAQVAEKNRADQEEADKENARLEMNRLLDLAMARQDSITPLGEDYLVTYVGGKIAGRATGSLFGLLGRVFGGAAEGTVADLGKKLDFLLGKSGGVNFERSISMLRTLQSIGIGDTPVMREYLFEYFQGVLEDSTNIVQTVGDKTTRESLLMGPFGGVRVTTIWQGNKLITFILKN